VISSVMFERSAATGVLPLAREACEATIRHGGRSAAASLEGFRRGFEAVARARRAPGHGADRSAAAAVASPDAPAVASAVASPGASPGASPVASPGTSAQRPGSFEELLALGRARCEDFQDRAYADLYEARVRRVLEAERAAAARRWPSRAPRRRSWRSGWPTRT